MFKMATAAHVKKFPVISEVLATSIQAQSPSLRKKAAELLAHGRLPPQGGSSSQGSSDNSWNDQKLLRHRLWRLLQATLKPGIFTHQHPKGFPCPAGNAEDAEPRLSTYLDEPEDSNPFNDFEDTVPDLYAEDTLNSDWVLPQLSAYGCQEYDGGVYPADGQSWQDDNDDVGYARMDAAEQNLVVEWQEMDAESLLDNESAILPSYHSCEQYRPQGPWDDLYQQGFTPDTMDEDHLLDERNAPMDEIVDWASEAEGFETQEFVDVGLVTSETVNMDAEGDDAHHLRSHHGYRTETRLQNDIWEYIG
ncbi:hypothetical protein DL765_001164 [Monosporascus sp. GIB2]|nr:hypothetical protein DL765_001164 [Monosporascus sp. GIB2]